MACHSMSDLSMEATSFASCVTLKKVIEIGCQEAREVVIGRSCRIGGVVEELPKCIFFFSG